MIVFTGMPISLKGDMSYKIAPRLFLDNKQTLVGFTSIFQQNNSFQNTCGFEYD